MVLSKSYETLTLKLCPFFNLILFSSNDWRSHYCSISSDVDRQQIHFYICLFKYRETQQLLCEILVQRPYETRCCTNDNWRCGFNRMRRLDIPSSDDDRFPSHITKHKLSGILHVVSPTHIIERCMFMRTSSNLLFMTFVNKMEPS